MGDSRLHHDYTPSRLRQLLGSHDFPSNRSLPGEIALFPASLPSASLSYLWTTPGITTLSQALSCTESDFSFCSLSCHLLALASILTTLVCHQSKDFGRNTVEGIQRTAVRTHFLCGVQRLSSSVAPCGPHSLIGYRLIG